MYKKILQKLISVIITMVVVMSYGVTGRANENGYAYISAYDYTAVEAGIKGASETGVILKNYKVEIANTTAQTIKNAFSQSGIALELLDDMYGSYIKSINGLGEGKGYAGWSMSYNNDDYSNWGIDYITLKDGDVLRFDYSNNEDYVTDDIGNGFYGLPIISKISLDGIEVKASKTSDYDEYWNPVNMYYIDYANGVKELIQGDGSEQNPFILNVPVKEGTDITNIKADYLTSLNSHYRITQGIDEERDYTNGVDVTISTLGGMHKSYYKIYAKRLNANGVGVDVVEDENTIKTYVYSNTDAKLYNAFYNTDKSLNNVTLNDIVNGVSLISAPKISNTEHKTFMWTNTMIPLN